MSCGCTPRDEQAEQERAAARKIELRYWHLAPLMDEARAEDAAREQAVIDALKAPVRERVLA